ncbi:retropepsin-like aspartic protease [Gracilinema caldarium]|jgi:hypothetical protein|uniref:retropepsin-like aspartic protease n=1 Tax=Gracilinema caldarium TaxID=215591 RepID=UPI0026EB8749|nr:retropepsin-like aspartic protease [Gracilinema caldarium]
MKLIILLLIFIVSFLLIFLIKNIDIYLHIVNSIIPPPRGGEWMLDENSTKKYYSVSISKNSFITINLKILKDTFCFLLDTGSSNSVIKGNIAQKIGFIQKKKNYSFYGGNIFNIISLPQVVLNDEIIIGPFVGKNIEWSLINENESEILKEIDGIIGRNILNNFIVNIDYSSGILELYMHNEDIKSLHYSQSLNLKNISTIDILYDGAKHTALIDTGSIDFIKKYEIGIVKENCFEHKFLLIRGDVNEKLINSTANIQMGDYIINGTVFKNISLKNIFVYKDIVFGIPFLSNFNWLFDFKREKVYFELANEELLNN